MRVERTRIRARRWLAGALVGLGGSLALAPVAQAQSTYFWTASSGGTWNTTSTTWLLSGLPSAWTNGPNTAVFGQIRSNINVGIATGGITAGAITLTSTGEFTHTVGTSGRQLTLDNGASDALISVGQGFIGARNYAGVGGNTFTGSPLVFTSNLLIDNNGALGTTALTIASTLNRSSAGGSINVSGKANTTISGAIGANVGGITKSGTGTLNLSGTNLFTGGVTVNQGVVSAASDAALGDAANGVTIGAGGTLRLTANTSTARALTINGSAGNPSGIDLNTNTTTTLTGSGPSAGLVGSGTALISLTSGANSVTTSTLSIEGAQTGFTGSLIVGSPELRLIGHMLTQRPSSFSATPVPINILRLQNAGALPNLAGVTVNQGSQLSIIQPTTAITNRLGSAPITLNNGRFSYTTSANGGAAINDSFGTLNLLGTSTLSGSDVAGPAAGTTLTFAGLNRVDNAGLWLRPGTATGIGGTPGANTVNYKLASAPTLSGSGVAGTPQVGIVPWAAWAPAGSTAPQNLLTYDANGFRPLAANELSIATNFAQLSAAAGNNVQLQNVTELTGDVTINSLLSTPNSYLIYGPGTLTVTSGTVVQTNGGTFYDSTLNFGANTGYLHLESQFTFDAASSITGTGGISVNGLDGFGNGYLSLRNTVPNTFTGGLSINGTAQVAFSRDDQLGVAGPGNPIVLNGGTLWYSSFFTTGATLDPARNIIVSTGNGTIRGGGGSNALQIPSLISGPGQLQIGGGTVQLTGGANTYSGGTIIGSSGTLGITNANQLGTGSLFLNRGTLRADADLTFASAPYVLVDSTINTNGFNIALNGGLRGARGTGANAASSNEFTKTGLGTLTVGADSTYAGELFVNGGVFSLSGGGRLPELPSLEIEPGGTMTLDNTAANLTDRLGDLNPITLISGGTFRLIGNASAASQETIGPITIEGNGSVIQVDASGAQISSLLIDTLSAPITSINTVLVRGTNMASASGPAGHVFLRGFTTNGVLLPNVMAEDLSNPGVIAPAIYDTAVGIRPMVGSDFVNGAVLQNAAPTNTPTTAHFRVNPSVASPVPVIGTSNAVRSLWFAPGGVLDYPGAAAGQLNLGSIRTEPGAAASITNSGAGLLTLTGGSWYVLTEADLTIAAGINISGGLSKNGPGTLTLNGPLSTGNTATLGLTINGGTLNLNSAPATAAPLRINAGTVNLGAGSASFASLTGVAGTQLNLGAATLTLTNGGDYSGIITGTGGLRHNSSALLTLGGASTFSGGITSTSGNNHPYKILHPSALGTGTLDLSSQTQNSFSSPILGFDFSGPRAVGTVPNNIILPSAAIAISIAQDSLFNFNSGQTMRLTGVLSGGSASTTLGLNGAVYSNGAVVILDNPNNTFRATILSNFDTFAFTSDGALGHPNNPIELNFNFVTSSTPQGGMRFDANNITVGAGRTITSNEGSINTNGNNGTIAGVLAGTGGLTKIGAGALTLSNNSNTFSGTLTISGGSLLVNGNLPGAASPAVVEVYDSGTLGGTGTIGAPNALRNVYIENGTIAPGNSAGILTVNGNVTFAPSSTFLADPNFAVELNGTTVGTGYDQLVVNGAVDLGDADLLLSLGFAPSVSDLFFLVNNDGTDAITGMFNGLAEGSSVTANFGGLTYTGQITYIGDFGTLLTSGGNDIALYGFSAVPEPGSLALLALVALPGAAIVLRRRK